MRAEGVVGVVISGICYFMEFVGQGSDNRVRPWLTLHALDHAPFISLASSSIFHRWNDISCSPDLNILYHAPIFISHWSIPTVSLYFQNSTMLQKHDLKYEINFLCLDVCDYHVVYNKSARTSLLLFIYLMRTSFFELELSSCKKIRCSYVK